MSPSLLQSSSSPPTSSWSNFLFTSFFLFCEHRSDCDWSLLSLNHCVADRADGDGDVNDCCVLIMIYETSLSTVSFLDVLCLQMGWLSSASGVETAVPGNHCKSGRDTFVEYLAHICHLEKTPLSAWKDTFVSCKLGKCDFKKTLVPKYWSRMFWKNHLQNPPKKILLALI